MNGTDTNEPETTPPAVTPDPPTVTVTPIGSAELDRAQAKRVFALLDRLTRRNHLPILRFGMLSSVEDGGTTIAATDLDISVRATLRGRRGFGKTPCLVPIGPIASVLKAKGEDTVWIEAYRLGERPFVRVGASVFPCGDILEFPSMPSAVTDVADRKLFGSIDDLDIDTLKWVSRAMSEDTSRLGLCGVAVDFKEEAIVATDGHRLHLAPQKTFRAKGSRGRAVVIPAAAVEMIIAAAGSCGVASAAVRCFDKSIEVRIGEDETSIWIRPPETDYPDWSQVVPKKSAVRFVCDREEFKKALTGAMALHRNNAYLTKGVACSLARGWMTVEVHLPDIGDFSAKLMCSAKVEVKFGVQGHYMIDAIAAGDSGNVSIGCEGETSPIEVVEENGRKAVVMPCRL